MTDPSRAPRGDAYPSRSTSQRVQPGEIRCRFCKQEARRGCVSRLTGRPFLAWHLARINDAKLSKAAARA